jgi:Amt family ammonium transporter
MSPASLSEFRPRLAARLLPWRATPVLLSLAALAWLVTSPPAFAQVDPEVAHIFNTFSFLICGALVMFMAAGFAMLEAGLVRSKNVATILLKNIALYAVAGILFYLLGYALMYPGDAWFGSLKVLGLAAGGAPYNPTDLGAPDLATGYSVSSDWFFQMVFVATAASVVSGTIAERTKLWSFMIFVVVLTGIIYPIQGSWTWGAGWLKDLGFSDFAGSTIVHSVGGWAALVGALMVGPRLGKFSGKKINALPGHSMPLATLGTFILWLGWFGFNGGSQLALGSAADATAMSVVFVNTNMAAAAGVVAAMITAQLWFGKVDLTMALNGALAGLVSITAGPDVSSPMLAMVIGGIGGALCVASVVTLERLGIDDVVGAISVHLVCGIWGTLAVGIFNPDVKLWVQAVGIVAIGAFVSISALVTWFAIDRTIGLRVSPEDETSGLDEAEIGLQAYPEFGKKSF